MVRHRAALTALVLSLLAPSIALAQTSLGHSPAMGAPPDVVVMKNGNMLRGTISELDRSGDVVIILLTGEARKIPMSETTFAGPKEGMPGSSSPAATAPRGATLNSSSSDSRPLVTVNGPEASLKLTASGGDLTYHLPIGSTEGEGSGHAGGRSSFFSFASTSYRRLCTAPCEVSLPAGSYPFALSSGRGKPVEADDAVTVTGPATLVGTYKSNTPIRVAGIGVMIAGAGIGWYLVYSSFETTTERSCYPVSGCEDRERSNINTTKIIAGTLVIVAGGIVGTLLFRTKDEASVRLVPFGAGAIARPLWANAESPSRWTERMGFDGIALQARF